MLKIAVTGLESDLCMKKGFLPVPIHFYSPIPDIEDLNRRKIWDNKTQMIGIKLREAEQLQLLKTLGKKYGNECNWPRFPTKHLTEFYTENNSFGGGCAAIAHSIIRHYRPKRFFEIGSGMSSLIIAEAMTRNNFEAINMSEYTVIDPYPNDIIDKINGAPKLIKSPVENLPTSFFAALKENDILFIDSGHTVRIGGDVNFLFLEVLPRLAPGVIVHVHDIRLPYEYSGRLAKKKSFRQFWTEQYMLQSFLCFNTTFEILLACNYLMVDHKTVFLENFPHCSLGAHPSSFWIRRKMVIH